MENQNSIMDADGGFKWDYLQCKDLKYPSPENFWAKHVYRGGAVLVRAGTAADLRNLCDKLSLKYDGETSPSRDMNLLKAAGCLVEQVFDDAAFLAARTAYHAETSRREVDFKRALFEREGLTDNPRVEACYSKAYERGHSTGFSEVANIFIDLADLIR